MINGVRYLMMGMALLFLTGCPSRRVVTNKPLPAPTTLAKGEMLASEADPGLLRARATRLWQAKVAEDWKSILDLFEPQKQSSYSANLFAEYGTEPVRFLSFSIQNIVTEHGFGWVVAEYRLTLIRYDTLTPITMQSCDKWRYINGNWYLVPPREAIMYPESPDVRDRAEEPILQVQFERSWAARRRSDWTRLYRMTDPRDHEDTELDSFTHSESEFRYLQCKIGWVEVIGNTGRVLAVYNRKSTEKKLKSMPPSETTIIEQWVKIDGAWYLDLN